MAEKIVAAGLKSGGLMSAKLTDLKGAELHQEHKAWLDSMIARATANTTKDVQVYIIGFASKVGDAGYNQKLSRERAWAVRDYINARSGWLAKHVTRFEDKGEGEAAEFGRNLKTETDMNDYHWRAVEVHLLGGFKPAPKPDVDPDPPKTLPGASMKWGMASAGAVSLTIPNSAILNVGLALFIFAKLDQDKGAGLYLSMPIGFSISVQTLLKLKQGKTFSNDPMEQLFWDALEKGLIQGSLKSMMAGGINLKTLKVQNPFRHKDLGDASMAQGEALAGLGKMISVSGKLPTFDNHGKIVRFHTKTFFEEFKKDIPIFTPSLKGVKSFDATLAKFTGGGLLRIAWV
ncbi:OmpA family protein [uncultured Alsobacter sp.]|uniref:OmpA family protein n=1 Tax=uncultured Alsobacter sp. TaxID=1748258 RepID=UPI0025D504FC|nr:OmpA family protein [uncultured Alsobacter sp.]